MKKIIKKFSIGIIAISINACSFVGKKEETKTVEDYTALPQLTVTFDGNGISWDSIEGIPGYTILKDGEKWKTLKDETFIVTIGEKGEFRVLAIDGQGKASAASQVIRISH